MNLPLPKMHIYESTIIEKFFKNILIKTHKNKIQKSIRCILDWDPKQNKCSYFIYFCGGGMKTALLYLNSISSTLSMHVAIFKSMFKVVRVDIFTITMLRNAYIIEIQQDMKEVLR